MSLQLDPYPMTQRMKYETALDLMEEKNLLLAIENDQLKQENCELKAKVESQAKRILVLEKRIEEREGRLGQLFETVKNLHKEILKLNEEVVNAPATKSKVIELQEDKANLALQVAKLSKHLDSLLQSIELRAKYDQLFLQLMENRKQWVVSWTSNIVQPYSIATVLAIIIADLIPPLPVCVAVGSAYGATFTATYGNAQKEQNQYQLEYKKILEKMQKIQSQIVFLETGTTIEKQKILFEDENARETILKSLELDKSSQTDRCL